MIKATIKPIHIYRDVLELYYGRYVIHIQFNFEQLKYEAWTPSSEKLFPSQITEKERWITIIKNALTLYGIKCTPNTLRIKTTGLMHITPDNAVCYIESEDLLNFLILNKLKGN